MLKLHQQQLLYYIINYIYDISGMYFQKKWKQIKYSKDISPVKIVKHPPQIATETILTQKLQKHILNTEKKV
jgi:hypothetical protein